MQEREISLVDLIVEILLRWRTVIVWMLIGAVVMGGFSYMRSSKAVESQKLALEQHKDAQSDREYLEDTLMAIQKNNVRSVLNYEKFSEYYNQSLLMQIDPMNVPKTELTFLLSATDIEDVCSLERIYEDLISCDLFQWVTENAQSNEKATGISELVTVDIGECDMLESGSPNVVVIQENTSNTDSFHVTIVHVTEKECKQLAQQVVAYVNEIQAQLTEQVGTHKIELVNEAFAVVADMELLNQQRNMVASIATTNANADKLQKAFTADEQRYYNLLKNNGEEEPEQTTEVTAVPAPSVSITYVFLGMVLFAFIYVFYLFLKYILNNKLKATDDIKAIYNVPQLGQIPQNSSKKKLFSFVDGFILKLRNRNKRAFSAEEATGLAAVAVKMTAKKEALDTVFCLGCDMKEETVKLAEKIKSVLKEENMELKILNNVLYNQETLAQLQGAGGAFLLEKAGETLYDEIAKEVELLQRQDIKILGVVVVE